MGVGMRKNISMVLGKDEDKEGPMAKTLAMTLIDIGKTWVWGIGRDVGRDIGMSKGIFNCLKSSASYEAPRTG